jgi:uncharacterized protein involved in exopolysaccharide biosynthesis
VELRKYFSLLWRKIIIVATAVVTIAMVAVGTGYITPVYQTSTLRIAVSAGGSLTSADYMYADRLMNTYIEIATSRPVVEELVKRLDLAESPTLKAELGPNTELIKFTVEDASPNRAAVRFSPDYWRSVTFTVANRHVYCVGVCFDFSMSFFGAGYSGDTAGHLGGMARWGRRRC